MKIGITGATGFIGRSLACAAISAGHEVVPFSRQGGSGGTRLFSLDRPPDVSGLDAVVHLAGEPILGLWTLSKRERILQSRVQGTRRVVEAIAASSSPPGVLVCSSGIGVYGDTGEHITDESDPPGSWFLADVARAWEAESEHATGTRVVLLRTGFVIGRDGGAMGLIKPVFRLGLGGRLGSGRQWMSCIHVADAARLILHAIDSDSLSGPLNATMPEPCRNAEFTRAAGQAARRPACFPAPSLALRIALGDLSSLLLESQRVIPARALETGFEFRLGTIESALEDAFSP